MNDLILKHTNNMPLLWSFRISALSIPPAHAGGYKDFAPTELKTGRERAEYPDFSLGQGTFKKAAIEDMGAEQERIF
jgi:hypothetical protein